MSDLGFQKAVVCTDQHFGRSQSSPVANQDSLEFFEWFCEEGKTWGAETAILCGDFFDSRHSMHITTMHAGIKALEMLGKSFKKVYALVGNHDLLYRHKRDVHSLAFSKYFPNIIPIDTPQIIGGGGRNSVSFLPWLVNDERKTLQPYLNTRYVFGHLECTGGFMMNAKVVMPDHEGALTADDFGGPEYVFSGHYHFRQAQKNLIYIGNTFPFNFADAWDEDRGMMFLEWGKEPYFKAWPDQPLFRNLNLSQLVQSPDKYLKSKLTARVVTDLDMSYEEQQALKDSLIARYSLRKLEFAQPPREDSVQDFTDEVSFQSVNQIVVEGLMSVDSTGINREMLIELFRSLPDL